MVLFVAGLGVDLGVICCWNGCCFRYSYGVICCWIGCCFRYSYVLDTDMVLFVADLLDWVLF